LMPDLEYTARTHGQPFPRPLHPGPPPQHAGFISPVEIDTANKAYDRLLAEFKTYSQASDSFKAQLLAAIDPTYTATLEDADFGYGDVDPRDILVHLSTNYGTLKPEEYGSLRDSLRAPWNPDDPIEDVWTRTNEIVRALSITEPVPHSAIIRDQLYVFEQTGVFPRACEAWREKAALDQTVDALRIHFARYNDERVRTLTAKQAGYHASDGTPPRGEAANAITPDTVHITTNNGVVMYYCHTHGLGTNKITPAAPAKRKVLATSTMRPRTTCKAATTPS